MRPSLFAGIVFSKLYFTAFKKYRFFVKIVHSSK